MRWHTTWAAIALCAAAGHVQASDDFVDDDERAARKLTVSETSFGFAEQKEHNVVTFMGSLRNTAGLRAREIVVQVDYFDGQDKLVDTVTQPLYGMVVLPGDVVSFRVRDEADKPRAAYARAAARVLSAEAMKPPKPKKQSSAAMDLLLSWGPMLLLIAVWILIVRRYHGKKSPQQRSLALIEQQTEILARQVATLERLAQAAEKQPPRV